MSNLIKILSLNIFFLTIQTAVCMDMDTEMKDIEDSALDMLSKIAISNPDINTDTVDKDAAIKESFYELCAYSVNLDNTKEIGYKYKIKETHPKAYDKWCEKLGLLNFLIPDEVETIASENEQLVCSILMELKNQKENLWVRYYAMYILATFDLKCLSKLRGYGDFYDEYDNLTPYQVYKLESALTEISNQDVNLKIKAKANYNLAKLRYLQINKNDLKNFNKYARYYDNKKEEGLVEKETKRPRMELCAENAFIACKNYLRTAQHYATLIDHKTTIKLAADFIDYMNENLDKN